MYIVFAGLEELCWCLASSVLIIELSRLCFYGASVSFCNPCCASSSVSICRSFSPSLYGTFVLFIDLSLSYITSVVCLFLGFMRLYFFFHFLLGLSAWVVSAGCFSGSLVFCFFICVCVSVCVHLFTWVVYIITVCFIRLFTYFCIL